MWLAGSESSLPSVYMDELGDRIVVPILRMHARFSTSIWIVGRGPISAIPLALRSFGPYFATPANLQPQLSSPGIPDEDLKKSPAAAEITTPVLFSYGSLDLFTVVDLGLRSQKWGRSQPMLRK